MTARRVIARLAGVVGVLWGAATLTFVVEQLMPTDPAQTILGGAGAKPTPEQLAAVRAQYGFDKPVIVQYFDYLGGLLRGDLGTSYVRKQPVSDIIGQQLGSTLTLTIVALVASWLIAVVGHAADGAPQPRPGRARLGLGDVARRTAAVLVGHRAVGGVRVHTALAAGGRRRRPRGAGVAHVDACPSAGRVPRPGHPRRVLLGDGTAVRGLGAGRGMSDWPCGGATRLRHAVLPGLTLSGWALGSLFSTAVIVEAVFVRPGLGRVLVDAVTSQDMPVVVGVTLFVAAVYVLANLLVNLGLRAHRPAAAECGPMTINVADGLTATAAPPVVRARGGRAVPPRGVAVGAVPAAGAGLGGGTNGCSPAGHPFDTDIEAAVQAPSLQHWFGTDASGRDIYTRVVFGARSSLLIGVGATALALVAAIVFGFAAGLGGRFTDGAISRFLEVLLALPGLLLALVFIAMLGPGVGTEIVAVALGSAAGYAWMVRGQVIAVKDSGLRQRRNGTGAQPVPDHRPARLPERDAAAGGAGDHGRRPVDRVGVVAELPRPRCRPAGPGMGRDARRRTRLRVDRVVAGAVSRAGDRRLHAVGHRARPSPPTATRRTADMTSLLQVEDLTVAFGDRDPVVRGVSFDVAPGECLAIVGESGSGKSVTARTLLGLAGAGAQVDATILELQGKPLLDNRDRDWRRIRGREVGFVLQDALVSLDPLRTVGARDRRDAAAAPLRQPRRCAARACWNC